ncbi:disulfide bond formation protein B [Dichotomicrobium thermohalophilum]|uniref:Disulfide bond formation protein DsbB n=1 Tax=Dichotomicrobium thermohalophilum TaxID=933063 RepID=A0A397QD20_9HYPH|nr:disulfide bond formation protein B [Dichotomicrobium thermohalophilum]RIA55984.1 disulfide bond formation protein DsbB [Dichotomicrobium thermohalophilum]
MQDIIGRIGMRKAALGVLALAGATILAALAYEHIGGYVPCELCYRQRWAYYIGIPAALVAALFVRSRPALAAGALAVVGMAFLLNTGLGIHHAGVEWGWWPGPAGCSGGVQVSTDTGALIESLRNGQTVRCDEPAFRFLGLSFAGWNAVISLGLAVLAGLGLQRFARRHLAAV